MVAKVAKVIATPAALELVAQLQAQYGPELMFHQSGGCCDNSAANCFLPGEITMGTGGTFSLGGSTGKAFHTRSRVFTAEELAELAIQGMAS